MCLFKKIFWMGERCRKCGIPLKPIKPGELVKNGWERTGALQCSSCGYLVCGECISFGLTCSAILGVGGCNCGSCNFNVFQMWAMY
jgi:hypothetical protein